MAREHDDVDVLLVEDNPGDARLIEHHLQSQEGGAFTPPSLTHVESLTAAYDRLEAAAYDLVVLDLGLPASSGLDTLDRYIDRTERLETEPTPVVVLTGLNDDETALRAVERGAQDYLVKDTIDGSILHRTIRHALERHRQERELTIMKQVLARVLRHNIRNEASVIRGHSEEIREAGGADLGEHATVIQDRSEELVDISEKARSVESVVNYDGGPNRQSLVDAVEEGLERVREDHPEVTVTLESRASPTVLAHPKLNVAVSNLVDAALAESEARPAVTVVVSEDDKTARVTLRGDVSMAKTDVRAVEAGEETPLEHASGVGLWLVYLVVSRSDGELELESGEATASVRLPTV